jgi:hypothetical protein
LSSGNGEVAPAHQIRTVLRLGVKGRADGKHIPGPEIQELRDQGGCPEINGDAGSASGSEMEWRIVAEDGSLPLREFDFQGALGSGAAGEAPSLLEFARRQ